MSLPDRQQSQVLLFLYVYHPTKNQNDPKVSSDENADQKMLQFDWLNELGKKYIFNSFYLARNIQKQPLEVFCIKR